MDWQIRLAILFAGLILVGYIYWDFYKKKKVQKANDKLRQQFGNLSDQVDASGFDLNGVGQARAAGESSSLDSVEQSIDDDIKFKQQSQTVSNEVDSRQRTAAPSGESIDDFIAKKSIQNEDTRSDFFENEYEYENESIESEKPKEPELVFSLILQAKANTEYTGKDFLPIFLSQGLRHGEMGIFHRHQKTGNNPGPVLFSLANAIAPGTFNVDSLDSFQTPALTLFMTLPGAGDAQIAYSAMVKTARLIVTELGGSIIDENQSVYSEQTHNHRLDQIQEYNRKSLS